MNYATAAAAAALFLTASGAAAQQTIAPGRSVEGRLEQNDPRVSEEQSHHDDYRLRLRAGERIRLTLESEDFDPMVQVYRADDLHESIAENDDSGESLNSRLSFSAAEAGDYVVRVLGFSSEASGRYTLRAETLPPLPAPVTAHSGTASTSWRVYQGELTDRDADNDGAYFDDYQVTLAQGQEVLIRVDSEAFDPIVQVLTLAGRNGPEIDSDDDAGPETNSLLGFRAPEAGQYIVRVTSFGSGGTGAYTLRVSN